jgi:hypothetical protein
MVDALGPEQVERLPHIIWTGFLPGVGDPVQPLGRGGAEDVAEELR